jgi:hypothetical protein
MTMLLDRFNIINKNQIQGTSKDIDTFIENIFNGKNIAFHPTILKQIVKDNRIQSVTYNYNCNHLRKYRNNLKQNIKKEGHKIKVNDTLTFIFDYISIIRKLNSYFDTCTDMRTSYDEKYKCGNSNFIKKSMEFLNTILINDSVFTKILENSINENEYIQSFVNFIEMLNEYDNNVMESFINKINTIIEKKLITDASIDDSLINTLYVLKYNMMLYTKFKKSYSYIKHDNFLSSVITSNMIKINSIILQADLPSLNTFVEEYQSLLTFDKDIGIKLTCGLHNIETKDNKIYYNKKEASFTDIIKLLTCVSNLVKNKDFIDVIYNQHLKEIFNKTSLIKIMVDSINYNIKHNIDCTVYYKLCRLSNNKDMIMKFLELGLMQRLIYEPNRLKEEDIFNTLKKEFHKQDLFKYNMILNDFKNSLNNNIIMTENMWKINTSEGHTTSIKENGLFTKNIIMNEKLFNLDHGKHKHLIHYPDIGYVDITIKNTKGRFNVRMLPVQLMAFELFSYEKNISMSKAYETLQSNLNNYSHDFVVKVFNSLVASNIVNKNNDTFTRNDSFNIDGYNCIDMFHNMNDSMNKIIKKAVDDLIFTRHQIIMANMNTFIKNNRPSVEDVYNNMVETIKQFKVTNNIFRKSLDIMVEKDYIKITDNMVEKLYY